MSFNLITESFIPIEYIDGGKEELNLANVLKRAHTIKEIKLESPNHLRQFALYRFLSVLVADITRPKTVDDILDLYESTKFEEAVVDKYFNDYKDRFDLYNDCYPFMQTPKSLFIDMNKSRKKVDELEPLIRSGTQGYL